MLKMFINLKDIMSEYNCGKNTASKIRQLAINNFDGKCFFDNRKVKSYSVEKAVEYLEKNK